MISMSNYNQKANSTITIVKFKGSIGKNFHFPIDFHFRLAVSKWIAPRSFLVGGVLGFPKAKTLYTWQANDKKNPNRCC